MSLRVFDWDANPEIDRHSYRISNARGAELVEARTHFPITCPDGRKAVQLYPPLEERMFHANFSDAWKMRPSGGFPVWQMVTA